MQAHLWHGLWATDDGLQYLKVIRTSFHRYWPNIYPIFIFRFILIINHHFVMLNRVTEHVSLSRLTTAGLTLNVMTQNLTTFWQRHKKNVQSCISLAMFVSAGQAMIGACAMINWLRRGRKTVKCFVFPRSLISSQTWLSYRFCRELCDVMKTQAMLASQSEFM